MMAKIFQAKRRAAALALLGGLALLSAGGCASTRLWPGRGPDAAALRGARREQALVQFETHRDTAQYQAALDRWKAGDPFTCEAQLRSLIARNPRHLEARHALADLALERGEIDRAEQELRELLALDPENAHTHHALGLLLDSRQRPDEARVHLAKAAALAPDNTLFQLCSQPELLLPEPTVAQR